MNKWLWLLTWLLLRACSQRKCRPDTIHLKFPTGTTAGTAVSGLNFPQCSAYLEPLPLFVLTNRPMCVTIIGQRQVKLR